MTSYLQTMLAGLRQWITEQKADWNQNDETAANYIKGRPCYEDASGKTVPLPAKYLPTIPADKLPTIPVEKLPTIPAEKLPTIPAEKLAKTFVIKVKVEATVLFTSTGSFECDFGGNTALYAAQMLRDQKAVIETTDGYRYAPCTNMYFDESGDGNYITFVLVNTADAIVEIAKLSIMTNGRIAIQRIIKLPAT